MTRRQNANGEGSVWLRKDGRWCAGAFVRTVSGRMERRYVYGKTRKDVAGKLAELQKRHDSGVPAGSTTLTVERYLLEWLDHMKHQVRPQTLAGYENNVRLHLVPRIGSKKLSRLTVRDVRVMVDDLRASDMSPRMVQWVHSTLRNALQHAFAEELVTRNVAKGVRIESPTKITAIEPFTAGEARTFLQRVREHRLYALWVLVLMLGLRRSEACGLHWSDVDLDNRSVRIVRGLQRVNGELTELPTKTRRSNRTVPLPALCVDALKQHRDRQAEERATARRGWIDTPYVFTSSVGTPLEPRTLTRTFHALCARHRMRRVRLHDLRHTCVSLLLSFGVNPRVVMEIVGHSAMEMTMNVYGHVTLDNQRAALDLLNDRIGDPGETGE
ncbi:MAG TPA: site-specific integrase [Pseudonocardia sp.]|nr:site-specific integrase [Pseudonocardia sp.]